MSGEPGVKFTQDYLVRKPRERAFYPISESDWGRLKRMIRRIVPARRIFQNLGSGAVGIFGSALLALVAVYSTENLPAWAKPTTLAIAVVSLVLGIAFYILDGVQKSIIQNSTDDVITEMEGIEKNYLEDEQRDSAGTLTTQQIAESRNQARHGLFPASVLDRAKERIANDARELELQRRRVDTLREQESDARAQRIRAARIHELQAAFRSGSHVQHAQFGNGVIQNIESSKGDKYLRVDFGPNGVRLVSMLDLRLSAPD